MLRSRSLVPGPVKEFVAFAGYDGEVRFGSVEDRGVRTAGGLVEDRRDDEVTHGAVRGSPTSAGYEALALIEQGEAPLAVYVELVVVAGPLVGGLGQRVGDLREELRRVMAQGDEQGIVLGVAGVIDDVESRRAEAAYHRSTEHCIPAARTRLRGAKHS
jgi:hypothetical protein